MITKHTIYYIYTSVPDPNFKLKLISWEMTGI